MFYIYKLQNKINDKSYIGFTNDPVRRYKEHSRMSNKNTKISKAIKKYGMESFLFEILFETPYKDMALEKEKKFITDYDSYNYGYNLTIGGEAINSGIKLSVEHKDKISKANKGKSRPKSPETRQKLSLAKIGKKNLKVSGELHPSIKRRKTYEITYKSGKILVVLGLNKFCRDNNYSASALRFVLRGTHKYHKDIIKIRELPT